jgi:hypothetical protein
MRLKFNLTVQDLGDKILGCVTNKLVNPLDKPFTCQKEV